MLRVSRAARRSAGIIGLPNVGKSCLFNGLTQSQRALSANYPFATIDPQTATVAVPDPLLERLGERVGAKRCVHSQVEITDIAGLVAGASQGAGLGNKFLANVADVECLLHVARCFEDDDVVHVSSRVRPSEDIGVIETELVLADLQKVDRRLAAARKKKGPAAPPPAALRALESALDWLNEGRPLREREDGGRDEHLRELRLLTTKPVVYVCNVSPDDAAAGCDMSREVEEIAARSSAPCVVVSALLEEDAAREDDPAEYRELMAGVTFTGIESLVGATARALGVQPFYTVGEQEARSWTVLRGTRAEDAAAVIHSDIKRGFIRAEIVRPDVVLELGSMEAARKAGRAALEGREYVMQPEDIVEFRFNV